MHVTVTCCGCSRQLRLPGEVIGSAVRCPLCDATFLTRALSDDRVEALPVADRPAAPKPTPPPAEEDVPTLTEADEDDVRELVQPDEKPPRRKRRRGDFPPVRFQVVIQHDPDDRLHGTFQAEVDRDGLVLWRGKGRLLEVPVGSECEYLGDDRLLLAIEGRDVELSAVHPHGMNDDLAREVNAYLGERKDTFNLPLRPRGAVVWLALLPFAIPILAVSFGKTFGGVLGFFLWGFFAIFLALGCLLIGWQRNWHVGARAGGMFGASLFGYLVLAVALAADPGDVRPPVAKQLPMRPQPFVKPPPPMIQQPAIPPVIAPPPRDPIEDFGTEAKLLFKHTGPLVWAGLTPDGQTAVTLTEDSTVVRVAVNDPANPGRVPVPGSRQARTAALSPDGRTLAVAGDAGALTLVDLPALRIAHVLANASPAGTAQWAVVFSPDGQKLATAHGDRYVRIWDVITRTREKEILVGDNQNLSLSWPNAKTLLVGNADRQARLLDLTTGQVRLTFTEHKPAPAPWDGINSWHYNLRSLAVARDQRTLVTASNDRTARVWDLASATQTHLLSHPDAVTLATFFPSGQLVVTGCNDGGVRFFEAKTGLQRGQLRGRFGSLITPGKVHSVAFTSDGSRALVGIDNRLELWQVEPRVPLRPEDKVPLEPLPANLARIEIGNVPHLTLPVGPLVVTNDGSHVVFAGKDSKLRVLHAATLKQVHEGQVALPVVMALSADGQQLATASHSHVTVTDLTRQKTHAHLMPNTWQVVSSLAFAPDGKTLAVGHASHNDGQPTELRLWDLETKVAKRTLTGPKRAIAELTYLPDGVTLASVSPNDHDVYLWEAATGRGYARLKGHAKGVLCVASSADGKRLASGGQDMTVRVWDMSALKQAVMLIGHKGEVTHLAFAPDGITLATASADRTVKLWDVPSGRQLHSIEYPVFATGVGFGAGGKTLFVRVNNGWLDRWELEAIEPMKKRPSPIQPDLARSPAAEAPDLQMSHTIAQPIALAVAPSKKVALVFTRDRQMLRYSYPDWKLQHSTWLGVAATSVALDETKGLLYAATCVPGELKYNPSLGWYGDKSDVAVYDVKDVLEGKQVPARLKPAATIPVGAGVKELCLTSEGRWLYYLAERKRAIFTTERLDTTTRVVSGTIEIKNVQQLRLRASPDGQKLGLLGRRTDSPRVDYVLTIDPATAKLVKEIPLPNPGQDLEVGNEVILATGINVVYVCDGTSEKVTRQEGVNGTTTPRLTRDGGRLYLVQKPASTRIDACVRKDKSTFQLAPSHTTLDTRGEAILGDHCWLTPDDKFLVGNNGQLVQLQAAGVERPSGVAAAKEPAREMGALRELEPWATGHTGRVLGIAVAPDGRLVLSASEDRTVLARHVTAGQVQQRLAIEATSLNAGNYAVAFTPKGERYAVAVWNNLVYTYDLPRHGLAGRHHGSLAVGVDAIAYSPDGTRLYTAGDKSLRAWGTPERSWGAKSVLTSVAAHPVQTLVAAGDVEGKIRLFDVEGNQERAALSGHSDEVRRVAFAPDGKYLASASVDGTVRIWDVANEKELRKLDADGQVLVSLAFAADAKVVAAGALDGSVRLWHAETGKELAKTPPRGRLPVYALAFAPDGKTLWLGAGSEVRRFDTAGLVGERIVPPKPIVPLVAQPGESAAVRLVGSRDVIVDEARQRVVTLSRQGTFLIAHVLPDFKRGGVGNLERSLYRLAFDGKRNKFYALRSMQPLVTGARSPIEADDPEVVVYEMKDLVGTKGIKMAPEQRKKLRGKYSTLLLAPDGSALYTFDKAGKQVIKLDAEKLEEKGVVKLDFTPEAMALTPNGKTLVVAGGEVALIDTASWKQNKKSKLLLTAREVVATNAEMVTVTGRAGDQHLTIQLDGRREFAPVRTLTTKAAVSLGLSVDGRWAYLVPHEPTPMVGRAWSMAEPTATPVEFRMTTKGSSVSGGEFTLANEGRYLLLNASGLIVKLPPEIVGK